MKHFGWLRKAAASVLALAMFAAAPAALAYSDANLEAPRAKNVVIDGDLSEWDTSRCLRIDSEKQIIDQIEHWDGEADCSMEIYAMWDEENLYIAAKVSRWMSWMPSSSSSAPTPTPTRTVQRTKRPTGASCSPRTNMTSSTMLTAK